LVGGLRKVTLSRKTVLRDEAFVLIEQEQIARPSIRSTARDGSDHRARRLPVLRLVVLRESREFLLGRLRKRRSAAGVLTDDAALEDVVLEADAVDEHVDLRRVETAGGDLFLQLIVRNVDAGRKRREIEEIALI